MLSNYKLKSCMKGEMKHETTPDKLIKKKNISCKSLVVDAEVCDQVSWVHSE